MKRVIFIFLGVTVKKNKKSKNFVTSFLLTLILAVVCIGGVELAVCSYASPELYQRITAPVRAGVQRAAEFSVALWEDLSDAAGRAAEAASVRLQNAAGQIQTAWENFTAEPEPEVQLVDNEAVAPPPRAQASYSITALVTRNGRECLTGGPQDLVYYNQTAEPWAEELYGSDPIGGYGCGPTAMSMVVSTLTDMDINPAQMAQRCVEMGYWAKKHGSYRTIVQGVAEEYGLTCNPLAPEEAEASTVFQLLSSGHLLVALVGPGHFTNSGHFIVLRGVTLDGSILVADPASQERSLTTWDLPLLLEELSPSRDSGGPLWVISPNLF